MKKINWLFTALAGLVLTCCTGEDLSEAPPVVKPPKQDVPILFSFSRGNTTRATDDYITGAEAAKLLDNKFVVTGFKGETTASPGSIVFDNYLVEYAENTANTTESNSSNWEYVNKGVIPHATTNGITKQTIKYWDYSVGQYDFIAWSTGSKTAIYSGTPSTGQVLVTNIQPNSKSPSWATGDDPIRPAYSFTGAAKDLSECYIADLVTVKKGEAGTYGEVSGYDKPVTLKFRALGSKVRIGLYETIPGYSVKNVEFYSAAASNDAQATTPKLFTTTANDIYTQGTYTIYYPTVDKPSDADNNQAHIKFVGTGDQTTFVDFGGLSYTIAESGEKTSGKVFLGRSSNTASFAGEAEGNYYTQYLPNESGTNLNLRVNYTLESIDGSGETIVVKGATAQVPLIYTQWKAGFAYTYLFKISDKTNGYTGAYDPTQPDNTTVNSDPAGLYPITFDAVVVNAEEDDQTQETITLISTPSITTYQKGSKVVDNNEYLAATGDIYVTVNDGNTGNTPDLINGHLVTMKTSGNDMVVLYRVADGTTEAFVNDALQIRNDDLSPSGNVVGRNGLELVKTDGQPDKLTLTDKVEYGVDGNVISLSAGQAAKFTPKAGTTYAFVYFKTIKTADEVKYEARAFSNFGDGETKYRYDYKAAVGEYSKSDVLYFKKSSSDVYTKYAPFIGQDVSNLYVKDGDNYVIASGLAVPNTQYYYTTDKGQSYKEAKNVSYTFARGTSLYTLEGTTYSPKTAGAPANNIAYYYKDGENYVYAVIMPEKTTDLFELDTTKYVEATEANAVDGQTYFDKYIKNNGVYYTKVIKVQ